MFNWTEIGELVVRDSMMHFGRSTANALSVRERNPPGS